MTQTEVLIFIISTSMRQNASKEVRKPSSLVFLFFIGVEYIKFVKIDQILVVTRMEAEF